MWMAQAQLARKMRQAVAGRRRQHDPGQVERVEQLIGRLRLAVDQEGEVEVPTVRHHRTRSNKVDQLRQHLLGLGGRRHIGIANPGQVLHRARNADLRSHQ